MNGDLLDQLEALKMANAQLSTAKSSRRRVEKPAPPQELSDRREEVKRASQKFTVMIAPFPDAELLKACDPQQIPSVLLYGKDRYSSAHTARQAEILKVFDTVPRHFHGFLGLEGLPWFREEVCYFLISCCTYVLR